LQEPWQQQAVEIFLEDFVVSSTNKAVSMGYFENLVPSINQYGTTSVLAQTVEAVALSFLSVKSDCVSISQRSMQQYGTALVALRNALSSPGNRKELFMSILLIGVLEVSGFADSRFEVLQHCALDHPPPIFINLSTS